MLCYRLFNDDGFVDFFDCSYIRKHVIAVGNIDDLLIHLKIYMENNETNSLITLQAAGYISVDRENTVLENKIAH